MRSLENQMVNLRTKLYFVCQLAKLYYLANTFEDICTSFYK